MVYFIVLVVLMNFIAFYLFKSSEEMLEQYEKSFSQFLLLNDISQLTQNLLERVDGYVIGKDQEMLEQYYLEKKLLQSKIIILQEHSNVTDVISIKNYLNMIESFIEQSDQTVKYVTMGTIDQYSYYFGEAEKIAGFIQNMTLSLLDQELNSYQLLYTQMSERASYYRLMAIMLFASTLLGSVIFSIWVSGGITSPIRKLSVAAEEMAAGSLDGEDIEVKSNDEIKLLAATFNSMRRNIVGLVAEIKKKSELDQLLKDLKLKSLQSQINPHFLFNTLNTIQKTAYLEDAHVTTRLIESVSALLRYNLGSLKKSSTLKQEVGIVKEYFYIQKTRFSDRIQLTEKIDEHLLDLQIPSLTLQPIIENAFIHGVESKEQGGEIVLCIYGQGQHVIIEVKDNGVGMSQDKIQHLLQNEEVEQEQAAQGHSTGIGVKNVIKRLQLFYEIQDVIEIESKLGEGTTFRFCLPKTKGDSA
jgi:sensor histidine kinase YesM